MYTCFVVCFVIKETSVAGILDDETCIHNLLKQICPFKGFLCINLNAFFFNWLKISCRFHFFVLEHSQMMSDGRTVRTTVRMPMRMNTGRVVCDSRHIRQE